MWTHKQFTFRWCLLFVSNVCLYDCVYIYKHNHINKHTNKQTSTILHKYFYLHAKL